MKRADFLRMIDEVIETDPGTINGDENLAGWDEKLLGRLRASRCAFGFTTRVAAAQLSVDDPLLLPRLDNNDLPQ